MEFACVFLNPVKKDNNRILILVNVSKRNALNKNADTDIDGPHITANVEKLTIIDLIIKK